jgi:hypothetical protein
VKSDTEGLIAATEAAFASADGVAQLWLLREQLEEEGRATGVHACSDLIVRCSIDHRVELTRAEELARELVQELPDKRHLLLLAEVLAAQGKGEEALDHRRLAAQTPNLHPQASEEDRKKAWEETLAAERTGRSPVS